MRLKFSATPVASNLVASEQDLAARITRGMGQATDGIKADWRDQIKSAGLGSKLANTVQGRTYPQSRVSLDPSAYVWTKAPAIISAYLNGATIVPLGGRRYLAIPTQRVPRSFRSGARVMTPVEVEAAFNQDLIIRKEPNGNLLAFVNVNAAGIRYRTNRRKNGSRWRTTTGNAGVRLELMFVLVRSVAVKRRTALNLVAIAEKWAAQLPSLI